MTDSSSNSEVLHTASGDKPIAPVLTREKIESNRIQLKYGKVLLGDPIRVPLQLGESEYTPENITVVWNDTTKALVISNDWVYLKFIVSDESYTHHGVDVHDFDELIKRASLYCNGEGRAQITWKEK